MLPPDGSGGTAYLLVLDEELSWIFPLPRTGTVVVGRDAEADLKLKDTTASRKHATIRIDDGVVRVSDRDSHNGTRVNGERITEARTLASGDVITISNAVLVLHFSTPITPARAAYAEAGWRRRLAEELDRAITFGRTLAVVALAGAPASALNDALRLIDVVGTGADGQSLLLLPEVDREQALAIARRAVASVPESCAGIAMCPADACDPDTILLAARSAARRAKRGTVACAADEGTVISLGEGRDVLIADPAMKRVFLRLEQIAPSDLRVLIAGEPGVGKENAAYAVHHHANRPGPFEAINCASIGPETLVESELFGHERGAFTGATEKKGLFERARGGTVFLDEVGELPPSIQPKLLRTLENRTIRRLGGSHEIAIDVRIVAATNRSLDQEVAAGRFRPDLLSRLAGATVVVPPLRDRKTEIPLLARAFLAAACARAGRRDMTIAPGAMQALLGYAWPANVRELKHAIEYAMVVAPDDTIEVSDLPEKIGGAPEQAPPPPPLEAPSSGAAFRPIADEIEELERRRMTEALAAAAGVKTRAAELIKMPIRTFTHKLKQYGM